MAGSAIVGKAEYQLGADLKPLLKELGVAETSIKKSGKATEDAFAKQGTAAAGKLSQAMSKLGFQSGQLKTSVLAGVGIGGGIAAFNLLSNAIGGVIGSIGDAVRAAAQEEVGIAQLTASLEANVEGWDGNREAIEQVISAREKLAFNDDEQRQSMALLVAATKDVSEAQRLQAIAMDLSRLRGTELVETTTLIGKVYQGNLTALKRFGISLGDVANREEALAKIQKLAFGQAAKYADTTVGKAERAQQALNNAMEDFGALMTPIVASFLEFASEAIPSVMTMLGELGAAFNEVNRALFPHVALQQDASALAMEWAHNAGIEQSAVDRLTQSLIMNKDARERAAAVQLADEMTGDFTIGADLISNLEATLQAYQGVQAGSEAMAQAVAEAYGVDKAYTKALLDKGMGLRTVAEAIAITATEVETAIDTTRQLTDAEILAAEAQARLKSEYEGTIILSSQAAIHFEAEREAEEKRTAAAEAGAEAMKARVHDTIQAQRAMDRAATAAETLAAGLETVAETRFKNVKKDAKDAREEFDKLIGGIDGNKKAIRELNHQINVWERNYRKAVRANDSEAAAYALAELERLKTEKAQREAVRKEIAAQRRDVNLLNAALGRVPKSVTTNWYINTKLDATAIKSIQESLHIGGLSGSPQRAAGGPVTAGLSYWVGEMGRRELFVPNVSGHIVPEQRTAAIGGGTSRHDHYHHIDPQSAQNLRAAGFDNDRIAVMLRQSAQSAGTRYSWGG